MNRDLPYMKSMNVLEIDLIKKQIDRRINTPLTSSCGRLFDAVSALLGIRGQIDYEAQAAVELEMAAYDSQDDDAYSFTVDIEGGVRMIRLAQLLSAVVSDLSAGVPRAAISNRFHNTVAQIIATLSVLLEE